MLLALLHRMTQHLRLRSERTKADTGASPSRHDANRLGLGGRTHSKNGQHRRGSSFPTLPEITDLGPPGLRKYENEDIFWNSTMVEAMLDPMVPPAHTCQQDHNLQIQQPPSPIRNDHLRPVRSLLVKPNNETSISLSRTRNRALSETVLGPNRGTAKYEKQVYNTPNHDVTTMQAWPLPNGAAAPQRTSILPATEEWDSFMDFQSDNSMHTYCNTKNIRCDGLRVRNLVTAIPPMTTWTLTSSQTASTLSNRHEAIPSSLQKNEHQYTTILPSALNNEMLTWNLVLNCILDHDAIDQKTKQMVRGRLPKSSITNAYRCAESISVSAQDVGLVPNFSYPILGSAFYDRMVPEHITPPISTISQLVYEKKVAEESRNDFPPTQPTASHSSHNTFYRAPTPMNTSSDRIRSPLSDILTPSELSLHNHIIMSRHTDIGPSSLQLHVRLVLGLHTTILGLQDRLTHLEETLVPQLSTWLEEKSASVDELILSIENLQTEVIDLKACVDFGSEVLGGCWEREGEVLSMAEEVQGRRGRAWMRMSRNDGRLRGRKVDALMLMAEQNLEILREDTEEMASMVRDYLERTVACERKSVDGATICG